MALARTNVGAFSSGANHGTGSFVTSSFTPANNSLLVVCVGIEDQATGSGTGANATISGGGLTFTKGRTDEGVFNGTDCCVIWTAPVVTGASMTLTLDCGANDIYRYIAHVFTETGYDTGTPTGGKGGTNSANGAAPQTFTLDAAPAAADEIFAIGFADGAGGQVITVGTGWTSQFASTPDVFVTTETITGVTSTTVTWNNLSTIGSAGVSTSGLVIKAAAGGGAAPFNQEDWPTPRGIQYPVSLRTWTQSYNPNLVGKDAFPPGCKGITYDLAPKPPRPPGPTWTASYNPNLVGKDVFPPGRKNPTYDDTPQVSWRRDWTQNLLLTTLAPVTAAPFRQRDWPLPRAAPQPDRTWISSALLLLLPPVNGIYTEPPQRTISWRNGWVQNLVLSTLVGQDVFPPGQIRAEPSPQVSWRRDWTQNLLLSTLGTVEAPPFAQYDWPLPQRAAQPDRTWTSYFNPNLTGQDAFPPGVVRSDRPQPTTWQNGYTQNLLLSTLAVSVDMPLNQYNWPVPGQPWQPTKGWTSSYNLNLIGQDQLPFRQTDWPVPTPYFYPASVRVSAPLNINLFPPPPPPIVLGELRNPPVIGVSAGQMGTWGTW